MKRPDLEELLEIYAGKIDPDAFNILPVIDYALELEKRVHALVTKRTDIEETLVSDLDAALTRK